MKKFVVRVLIFCFVFFILEKLFFILMYLSPSLEVDRRLEQVIKGEINKDIIILGSSHGARNIIAKQIKDSLNLDAYNLSYPGSNIEFHEFILRSIIKFNSHPKIILLAVDDDEQLLPSNSIVFRYERLYPLAIYSYINDEMISRKQKTIFSKILAVERINKSNFNIIKKHFSELDTIYDCGSMPISFQRVGRKFEFDTTNKEYKIDNEVPEKLQSFLKFKDLCVKNNIKLILVYSPNFKKHNINFQKRLEQLTNKDAKHFVYDTTNKVYLDKSYYYDESHLQKNGAIIFTNEIIEYLKRGTIEN